MSGIIKIYLRKYRLSYLEEPFYGRIGKEDSAIVFGTNSGAAVEGFRNSYPKCTIIGVSECDGGGFGYFEQKDFKVEIQAQD